MCNDRPATTIPGGDPRTGDTHPRAGRLLGRTHGITPRHPPRFHHHHAPTTPNNQTYGPLPHPVGSGLNAGSPASMSAERRSVRSWSTWPMTGVSQPARGIGGRWAVRDVGVRTNVNSGAERGRPRRCGANQRRSASRRCAGSTGSRTQEAQLDQAVRRLVGRRARYDKSGRPGRVDSPDRGRARRASRARPGFPLAPCSGEQPCRWHPPLGRVHGRIGRNSREKSRQCRTVYAPGLVRHRMSAVQRFLFDLEARLE